MTDVTHRKIQYYEAYRSGEISRDDFIQRKASLVSRISDLQSKREKIETERAQSQREADACRSAYRELEEYLSASDLSGDRLKAKMYEASAVSWYSAIIISRSDGNSRTCFPT